MCPTCCCRCAAAVAPPGGRAALLPTWGQPASTPLAAAAAAGRGQGHGPAAAAAAAATGGTPHAGEQVGASLGVCGCVGAARGGAAGEGGGYTDQWRKGSGKYTTTYCIDYCTRHESAWTHIAGHPGHKPPSEMCWVCCCCRSAYGRGTSPSYTRPWAQSGWWGWQQWAVG